MEDVELLLEPESPELPLSPDELPPSDPLPDDVDDELDDEEVVELEERLSFL